MSKDIIKINLNEPSDIKLLETLSAVLAMRVQQKEQTEECSIPQSLPVHPTALDVLQFKGKEQEYFLCRFNSIMHQLNTLQRDLSKTDFTDCALMIRNIMHDLRVQQDNYTGLSRQDLSKRSLAIGAGDSGIDNHPRPSYRQRNLLKCECRNACNFPNCMCKAA